ncbi:hypothetical protein OG21DRAFT_1533613 [Imleria badia]|nr:hypothetical protein OG21DRAFT_1533613 [Imleria badia]
MSTKHLQYLLKDLAWTSLLVVTIPFTMWRLWWQVISVCVSRPPRIEPGVTPATLPSPFCHALLLSYCTWKTNCTALCGRWSLWLMGVIDIGHIGELVSCFIWLLAKDFFVRKKVDVLEDVGWGFDQALEDCQLVPVIGFLEFVFGPKIWEEKPEAQEEFQNAYINFSHWVSMNFEIRHSEGYPMYFKPQNPGDRGGVSQILISDKAGGQKAALRDIQRDHWSISPGYHGLPYIAILVDLSMEKPDFDVWVDSSKDRDTCLCIYAHGLNETMYPFLVGGDKLTCILKDLYKQEVAPSERSLLQDLENQAQFGKTSEPCNMDLKKCKR